MNGSNVLTVLLTVEQGGMDGSKIAPPKALFISVLDACVFLSLVEIGFVSGLTSSPIVTPLLFLFLATFSLHIFSFALFSLIRLHIQTHFGPAQAVVYLANIPHLQFFISDS